MKTRTILMMSAVAALVIAALSLNSCSKEELGGQTEKSQAGQKDYTIFNTVSAFSNKMAFYKENPAYKSGESIEADSAIWLMEGAMNLTYGFPFEVYGEYTTGTATLSLQKNQDGEITLDEVAIKYQQLIDSARADYYSSGYENKGLYLVNLQKTGETTLQVSFSLETVTGNKGIDPYPFNLGDNWWYGEFGGGCANNTQPGIDAAHELAAKYNENKAYNMTEYLAIAGPGLVEVQGGESWLRRIGDPEPEDNLNDYYIFSVKDNVDPFNFETDLCLMANEMSTYYWYLDYVITELAPVHGNIPDGYVFIKVSNQDGNKTYYPTPDDYTSYHHYFKLLYGLPYEKGNCNSPINL